jgi:hypothetical protein
VQDRGSVECRGQRVTQFVHRCGLTQLDVFHLQPAEIQCTG